MTDLNKKLAVLAAALLALALLTYRHDAGRADRFETGQKFLQNLNPDEIGKIEVSGSSATGSGEGGSVTLTRQGEEYVIAERNGYLARNEEVNRLVRDLLEVSLDRRMGTGDELAAELGFGGDESTSVTLSNASGEVMVQAELGDSSDNGGRYLRRRSGDDQAIYRSEAALTLSSEPATFLAKEILDHSSSEVVRIEAPGFVLAKQRVEGEPDETGAPGTPRWEGSLELEDGSAKTSEVNRLATLLSRLSFDEVFLASDPAVASLRFDRRHTFELDDQSGYQIESATVADGDGQATYVRLRGLFNVDRLEVSQEETDEELEEKAGVLASL